MLQRDLRWAQDLPFSGSLFCFIWKRSFQRRHKLRRDTSSEVEEEQANGDLCLKMSSSEAVAKELGKSGLRAQRAGKTTRDRGTWRQVGLHFLCAFYSWPWVPMLDWRLPSLTPILHCLVELMMIWYFGGIMHSRISNKHVSA